MNFYDQHFSYFELVAAWPPEALTPVAAQPYEPEPITPQQFIQDVFRETCRRMGLKTLKQMREERRERERRLAIVDPANEPAPAEGGAHGE